MTNLTNLQLHYDKANEGRCLVCGRTMNSREYYCHYCVDAEAEEMLKESAYQVDDWVEVESGEHCLISMVGKDLGSGYCYYFKNSTDVLYESSIVRKLKANEVIISIGCLSGRVERMYTDSIGAFLLTHVNGERSSIRFSALDDETRELVESLLKRIEDE